jgi:hypothetical protein
MALVTDAQAQRQEKAIIVPAPGPVTVDGDLRDWDLSASFDSVYQEALAPRFTARFAFMYDRQAFYIGAHIVDDTPLVNQHDPLVEPNVGWSGDALQVRLSSDPALGWPLKASTFDRGAAPAKSDRIVHLTLWYFTGRSEPVLQVQYGMDYHGTRVLRGAASGVAFRKDPDGRVYTLEARIPWSLLNAAQSPPKSGDRTALTVQPLWGDTSGTRAALSYTDVNNGVGFGYQNAGIWGRAEFVAQGDLPASQRPVSVREMATPLVLELPLADAKAASLSAALFDAGGVLVRTLPVISNPTSEGGKLLVRWDGLDDDGRPLPPGRYTVKFLTHEGIGQKYVASLHNAGNPPWRTADGTGAWGGDHGNPLAAGADGERVYLGWDVSEAGSSVIAVDPTLPPGGVATRIGRKLWGAPSVPEVGIGVQALATDGDRVFVAQGGKRGGQQRDPQAPNAAGVVLWDTRTGRAINFPFNKRVLLISEWRGEGRNLRAIALSGHLLYASLEAEDKVVSFNWKTGQKIREYVLPAPAGLAVEKNGTLVVLSERSLMRLDPDTGHVTRLVHGLSAPWGVAVDRAGHLYVSDQGTAMQVNVYAPDGTLLRTVGTTGGRPMIGKFDPHGMLNPAGLAIDAEGKLWVTEYDGSPRRVSVWTADGRLVGDLLGAGQYATMGTADPGHPSWVNTHHTLFELDYDTGSAKTLATLVRPGLHGFQVGTDGQRRLDFRRVHGHTYIIHGGRGSQTVFLLDEPMLSAQPVAAMGRPNSAHLLGLTPDRFPEAERAEAQKRLSGAWLWTDRNGDRLVQLDEIDAVKGGTWGLHGGSWFDDDLTIWSAAQYHAGGIYRVPVKEWLPGGVPLYPSPGDQTPLFTPVGATVLSVMPSSDLQSVFVLEQKTSGGQPTADRWEAVSRYDLTGRRLWSYRKAWVGFGLAAPLFQPGYVIGAMKFIGDVGLDTGLELLGVNGYAGQFNILTSDGLWVAALGKDNRYGPRVDETTIWPENFSGFLFRNADNGKVYLMAGDTDLRIWEVTELDTIRAGQVAVTLTEADWKMAVQAAVRNAGRPSGQGPLPLRRIAVAVDGSLTEWNLGDIPAVDAGAGRTAKIALGYDDANLYVAAAVADDSPLKNSGSDYALLFKTGASVNVVLAADLDADPKRSRPAAGDTRLLFSVLDQNPVAVLYQAVVAPGTAKEPRLFGSPTGAERFDRVTLLKDARVTVRRTARGYQLEAAVPLASIGFAPKPGQLIRGDVGVIFSDPDGTLDVLRAYLFDRDTAIVNDIPSEARLEPAKWGFLSIE